MNADEGNAFYSNSRCMEDYLDEDNDAMKMIKSGEFSSTFDQFMANIEKEITNVDIEENELLDVGDYHTGNLQFMTEGSRTEELEEGKMIGIGAVINQEYPEGNIIVDYNNYNDPRINVYIPGLSGNNEDSSLFDEDHYFWEMKNVENLSHEETINNLNRLIDNLDKWLVPTPIQNTDMVEPLMDTETDDPNDDELKTKDMDMERNEMDTEMDDPNDDELNTKDNMDMERNEMDTEMDDPNDDELNTKDNMDMERNETDTGTDDPNDGELNPKDNMDMERNEMDTETDDPNDGESNNTIQKPEINPEHYMCKELPVNIRVVENLLDNDNDDRPGTAVNHHTDVDRRQKNRGNIFRRCGSYIRKRTKIN